MLSDNQGLGDMYHFDVNGKTREMFDVVMELAMLASPGRKVTDVKSYKSLALASDFPRISSSLILYWADPGPESGAVMLPYPMCLKQISEFVWGWLESLTSVEWPPEPEHDGSNSKGWRIFNERWSQIDGEGHYAFAKIEPFWQVHGK